MSIDLKSEKKIQFCGPNKDEFLCEVRSRVNEYFKSTGQSQYATFPLHIKGIMLFLCFFLFWGILIFGWLPEVPRLAIWMLFGANQGLLAMNVGHDALHGSYSSSMKLNRWLGYLSYDLVGLSSYVWKYTHNQGHHTFTNIAGHDPDIDKPGLLRLSPHDPIYPVHRYQHWYIWFLYSLVGLNWVLISDYQFVWERWKTMKTSDLVPFFIFKAFNITLIIALPLLYSPMGWKEILIGYLLMQFTGGLIVAIIFQLAHIVENVDFPLPDNNGVISKNWGAHEMYTTSNFAIKSPFITHLFGGLNFQIEHHLMPKVSHAHYRQLSSIIKQAAEEHGLPYHSQPTLQAAVASHIRLLKKFGNQKTLQPLE